MTSREAITLHPRVTMWCISMSPRRAARAYERLSDPQTCADGARVLKRDTSSRRVRVCVEKTTGDLRGGGDLGLGTCSPDTGAQKEEQDEARNVEGGHHSDD